MEWTLNDSTGSMDDYSFTAGYDDEDRLVDWDRSNGDTQDWTLTKVGDWSSFNENGTAVSRTHNDVHELTAIGANSLTYDVKGNLLTDTDNHTYVWDFDNHLKSAAITSTSTRGIEGTHTYEYDALGRRVAKEVSDESGMTTVVTRTIYINNYAILPPLSSVGGQVLAEYEKVDTGSVTLARTYTYGEYVDEPLSITDHSGTPVTYYYHQNRVFNVVGLTDDNDTVIELYTYTPYGTVDTRDPSNMSTRTASNYNNPYTFTGRRTDEETKLHYFRARYMDPVLGRFAGRDPLGYIEGADFYRAYFVPHSLDPSGMCQPQSCLEKNFPNYANGTKAEPGTCTVKICERPIRSDPLKTFGHIYIVVVGPDQTYTFGGGPVGEPPIIRGGVFPIDTSPEIPKDKKDAKTHVCTEYTINKKCSEVWCCMFDLAGEVRDAKIPYKANPNKKDLGKGANSNSFARWMSEKCLKGHATGGRKPYSQKPFDIDPGDRGGYLPGPPGGVSYPTPGWNFPLPEQFTPAELLP